LNRVAPAARAPSVSHRLLKRKENSSQNGRWRLEQAFRYRPNYLAIPGSRAGILTCFPFAPSCHCGLTETSCPAPTNLTDNHVETTFAATLRNDSPIANCSSNGTIIHFSLKGSHLNICYYNQDPHQRYFHAGSRPDASKNYHTFQQPKQERHGTTHTPHIPVCIHSVFTSAPSYSSKL